MRPFRTTGCRAVTRAVKPVQEHGRAELLQHGGTGDLVVGGEVGPPSNGVSAQESKNTGRTPVRARSMPPSRGGSSASFGRLIGPMPVTRRLTHSTGWRESPRKA